VLLTPWNWYGNDQAILYTLGVLGALIGPLFGILIAGYYIVGKQRIAIDDMYSTSRTARYWYRGGFNPNAIWTLVVTGAISVASAVLPPALGVLPWLASYSWFIGCGLGLVVFWALERVRPSMPVLDADDPSVDDGAAVGRA